MEDKTPQLILDTTLPEYPYEQLLNLEESDLFLQVSKEGVL